MVTIEIPRYPNKAVLYAVKSVVGGSPRRNIGIKVDETDHFSFMCPKCQKLAEIERIEITNYMGYPELYFAIFCPRCSMCGYRRVWAGEYYAGEYYKEENEW